MLSSEIADGQCMGILRFVHYSDRYRVNYIVCVLHVSSPVFCDIITRCGRSIWSTVT